MIDFRCLNKVQEGLRLQVREICLPMVQAMSNNLVDVDFATKDAITEIFGDARWGTIYIGGNALKCAAIGSKHWPKLQISCGFSGSREDLRVFGGQLAALISVCRWYRSISRSFC